MKSLSVATELFHADRQTDMTKLTVAYKRRILNVRSSWSSCTLLSLTYYRTPLASVHHPADLYYVTLKMILYLDFPWRPERSGLLQNSTGRCWGFGEELYSTRHVGEERLEARDKCSHPHFVCKALEDDVQ
jgi:hypothetical protein